jgi:hypothetical protein
VQKNDGGTADPDHGMEWFVATKRSVQERRRSRRRAMIVVVPTLAGVFIAGTAFAYWTTNGSGSATSSSGTTQAVTVTQTGTLPSGMAPGGPDQGISFKITNPKATAQYITSVTIAVGAITKISDGSTATGCTSADFAVTQPSAINANLASGDTAYPAASTGAAIHMQETGQNQDACKNVNVGLTFTAA